MATECYQIGRLLLNAGTQEVTRDGEPVSLPPLSFSLLLTLARHAPNVVTTAQLEEEVWSGLVIDRGTINKRVVLVRNALRAAGCEKDYIAVVRGTGYRLAVPVERVDDAAADGSGNGEGHATAPHVALDATPSNSTLRWLVLALVVVVLGAVIGTDLFDWRFGPAPIQTAAPDLAPLTNFSGADSIAVLPLEPVSDSEGDQYFAEGIAREIIHRLGHYSGLSVASPASSFEFQGASEPTAEIGRRLGVQTLLGGSVHRQNGRIIVMTSLRDAASGQTIWADRYDHPENEIFQVQDDIVNRVASVLRVSPDERSGDGRVATTGNIEAYTLYLKGQSQIDRRISEGVEPVRLALKSFRDAARLDPDFVRAHIGLASASFLIPSYDEAVDRDEWLARAEASARYALDLDPSSAEATGVLAAIVSSQGDPLRAAGLFNRAMDLGNRDPNVLHWHAMLATSMGYFEGLLPVLEDAYRLDPLNQLLGCSLAGSLNFSGQPEEALVVLGGMEHFDRRDLSAAVASLYLGDWDAARSLLRGLHLRMGVLPVAYADLLVEAFANPPRREYVEQAFVEGVHRQELLDLVAFEALLIMGSPRAFDLEAELTGSWFEHRLPEAVWHNWGVELRRDARFKGWIRALGYDQYWRKYGWPDRCRPTGLDDFECV